MKVGLISERSKKHDLTHNIKIIKNYAKTYSQQLDMICFGEAFLHGYDALSWLYEKDKLIASSRNSNEINQIRTIAEHNNIAIAFGYFEHDEDFDIIYCSYIVIDHTGKEMNHYRRVSKGWRDYTKTNAHYGEGNGFHSFSYKGTTFVTALCGDLWYEEHVKEINKLTKDFVLWPLHIDYTKEEWNNDKGAYMMQTNKITSPILMINNISDTSFGGCYVFNQGKITNSLSIGHKGVLVVTI